jgi:hypothetical protein
MQGPVLMPSGVLYTEQDSLGGISREGSVSDLPRNAGAPLLAAAVREDWVGAGAAAAAAAGTARFEGPTSHPLEDGAEAAGEEDEALPADLEDEYEGAGASINALSCWPALLPMPNTISCTWPPPPPGSRSQPPCPVVHVRSSIHGPCRGMCCQRLE